MLHSKRREKHRITIFVRPITGTRLISNSVGYCCWRAMDQASAYRHRQSFRRLQWKRDFAIRQVTLYHGQDNRLKFPPGGSMVEEFLTCYSPDFIPPRRYELLRRFLERTGARSFPEAIRSFPADKRILAMIDDRCDPCVSVSLPSGARFLPLRQWESDSYMQRPPEGLHIHVYGADAETLHVNLQKDVCQYVFSGFLIAFAYTYMRTAKGCCRTEDSVGLSSLWSSFESVLRKLQIHSQPDSFDGFGPDFGGRVFPPSGTAILSC